MQWEEEASNLLLGKSRINYEDHTVDRQGCLGDVRRHHDLQVGTQPAAFSAMSEQTEKGCKPPERDGFSANLLSRIQSDSLATYDGEHCNLVINAKEAASHLSRTHAMVQYNIE